MSEGVIFNLSKVINFQLEADRIEVSELLKKNKINITIVKGPSVNIKTIKVSHRPIKRHVLPKETVERVQVVKQVLKGNSDAVYLLAILSKARELVKNIDYKHLNPVGAGVIEDAIEKTMLNLSKAGRQLLSYVEKK